ncbi:asparagine synthase (glutamine-hydrolyzing) [Candidatus Dependentiae bacterium]|nr:asparagine synthase (glutamine-hydrolyzing) [Candidatus Dependentiae bacterium]
MCGITGFYGNGDKSVLESMTHTLFHRGPDEFGIYQDDRYPVFLGHRRLIIRDRIGGCQPMKTEDNDLVIIYNGQIYNDRELRKKLELSGYKFKSSHSDTEILLHGYKEWKYDIAGMLNGMWAFVIFDKKNKKFFISRDRFGKKPLYYTLQNGVFAFASELKAFKKHNFLELHISKKNIQKYHGYGYFPGDKTIYKDIYKLKGGHNLVFDIETFKYDIQRYWTYSIEPDYSKNEKYWTDEIIGCLSQAVERRLVSDVPLGLFLSGGLDSSIVSYLAKKKMDKSTINSFSIRFLEPGFDETQDALFVSDLIKTEHSVSTISSEIHPEIHKEMFSLLDEPFSDSSMYSYYLLCRNAKKKVTVILGGDAGDELFAGYDTFKALKIMKMMETFLPQKCYRGLISILSKIPVNHSYMTFRFKLERLLKGYNKKSSLWNPMWLSPVSFEELNEIAGEPVVLEELYSEAIEAWEECKSENYTDKTLEFYGKIFLQEQILTKVDRLSMMNGLEVRVPFLDIDVINCVRKIPSNLKLKNGEPKYILKKSFDAFLPEKIVWKKKIGLSSPLSRWFYDKTIKFEPSDFWNRNSRKIIIKKNDEHKSLKNDNRLFLWNSFVLDEFTKYAVLK